MGDALIRQVYLAKLRPDKVGEYCRLHRNLDPDLVAMYRQAGIRQMSCFVSGTWLIITAERDPEIAARMAGWLAAHPLEQAWQRTMGGIKEDFAPVEEFREVCYLGPDPAPA